MGHIDPRPDGRAGQRLAGVLRADSDIDRLRPPLRFILGGSSAYAHRHSEADAEYDVSDMFLGCFAVHVCRCPLLARLDDSHIVPVYDVGRVTITYFPGISRSRTVPSA